MNYLSLNTSHLHSPEFIGAEPVQRATWIALLGFCAEQENLGVIEGCRSWGERRWMQTCGVMLSEIEQECELYRFDGDDLLVFGYPHEMQAVINANRANGKLGGRPRKNREKPAEEETQMKPNHNPPVNHPVNPDVTHRVTQTEPRHNPAGNPDENVSKVSNSISPPYVGDIQGSSSSLSARASIEALPTSVGEVVKVISASRGVHPIGDELILCATKFFETMEIQGWVTRDKIPIAKWSIAAQRWATKWVLGDRGKQCATSAGQPPDKDYSFDLPSSVNPQANTNKP